MARLVKKQIEDVEVWDGNSAYVAIFDGEPTEEDIASARSALIKHDCFSGKISQEADNVIDPVIKVEDECLREGYTKYIIGVPV